MVTFKTIMFSSLAGKPWFSKEDVEPAPKIDDMSKLHDRIKRMKDKFDNDTFKYFNGIVKHYGTETDSTVDGEYYIKLNRNKKGISYIYVKTYRKCVYIEMDGDIYPLPHFNMDEQMEIMQIVDKHVKTLERKNLKII